MNKEIFCIINKENTAKNEWENDDSDFQQTYNIYEKIRTIFFPNLSVLLKVTNILNKLTS